MSLILSSVGGGVKWWNGQEKEQAKEESAVQAVERGEQE